MNEFPTTRSDILAALGNSGVYSTYFSVEIRNPGVVVSNKNHKDECLIHVEAPNGVLTVIGEDKESDRYILRWNYKTPHNIVLKTHDSVCEDGVIFFLPKENIEDTRRILMEEQREKEMVRRLLGKGKK